VAANAYANPDVYNHVRSIISIVLGLSIARLFAGLARFVAHPERWKIYPVHLGLVLVVLLYVVEFWWWEFSLLRLREWTFPVYLFVIFYAGVFVFLCWLLFPEDLDGYKGFEDYFMSRRKWFFGLFAMTFVLDFIDTAVKGADYFHSLGAQYVIRNLLYVSFAVSAMFVSDRRFHVLFVGGALLYQLIWMAERYNLH